jgi:hypothetical protein
MLGLTTLSLVVLIAPLLSYLPVVGKVVDVPV